jgi:hypothetical protein
MGAMRRAPLTMLAAAAAMVLISTAPRSALAGGDAATAEALFRSGVDKLKKGDAAGACDDLKGSTDIDPSPGTQINLGLCSEKQGKLASAWAWYLSASGLAEQRGQKERAENAKKDADRIAPQLHKLVIKVSTQPEGLTITRDGTALPPATYGREVPVDPGPHVIEVAAKGKKPIKVTVNTDATPGAQTWEVPTLEDAPEDKSAGGGNIPGSDARPPETRSEGGNTQRNVGFVVGGAGIVALLTGGALQILAVVVNNDAKDIDSKRRSGSVDCTQAGVAPSTVVAGSTCGSLNSTYQDKKDAAKNDQLAAIITGAGGAVLIGVGVTLILTSKPSSSAKSTYVVPMVGQGQAGLGLMGSF